MRTEDLITNKLTEAFEPQSLTVLDESHQHEGHAGHREGGQTHFRVYIVSQAFKGKTRLERHRMINATLAGELKGGVHALAIHAAAPGEGAYLSSLQPRVRFKPQGRYQPLAIASRGVVGEDRLQRTMNLELAVAVFDVPQFSKLVHELVDARARGADILAIMS